MLPRILLGPGPSLTPPSVQAAMALPPIGHMDVALLPVLDEIVTLLRETFQTANEVTFPISGTGTAGMEAAFANTLAPGTRVLVASCGYFAERMAEVARRLGAEVTLVDAPWGQMVDPADVERALRKTGAQVLGVVHVETSTGVCQPCREFAQMAHNHSAVILVDAVASLGGMEIPVDQWEIDLCYSGSQKCLSAPPGLAPLTLNSRVRTHATARTSPSFYLDIELLWQYWGPGHAYHHTAPVPLLYALQEALRLVHEEGLSARVARHQHHAAALWAGLEALGLRLFVPESLRASSLTTVHVPDRIDEARVRRRLLEEYGIEIAGGLGPLRGRIWRIGLMGYSSQIQHVILVLFALENILRSEGFSLDGGAAVRAASRILATAPVL